MDGRFSQSFGGHDILTKLSPIAWESSGVDGRRPMGGKSQTLKVKIVLEVLPLSH